MTAHLDEEYFRWLYAEVANVKLKRPSGTYWTILRQLFTKEFVWLIPNDDNRVEDGRELRYEFLDEFGISADEDWMGLGCSVLEMLLGVARRLAFKTDHHPQECFWEMMANLGLRSCNDASGYSEEWATEVIENLIWRTYDYNGIGGLFPLDKPEKDQREVEIWYQMSAYIIENYF